MIFRIKTFVYQYEQAMHAFYIKLLALLNQKWYGFSPNLSLGMELYTKGIQFSQNRVITWSVILSDNCMKSSTQIKLTMISFQIWHGHFFSSPHLSFIVPTIHMGQILLFSTKQQIFQISLHLHRNWLLYQIDGADFKLLSHCGRGSAADVTSCPIIITKENWRFSFLNNSRKLQAVTYYVKLYNFQTPTGCYGPGQVKNQFISDLLIKIQQVGKKVFWLCFA